jgi:hypothetical protein
VSLVSFLGGGVQFNRHCCFRVHSHPHCSGPHRTALPLLCVADGWMT